MVDLRMNQAASAATHRQPAGSAVTAGTCCPLFNNLLFMNTFATQAPTIPAPDVAQQCPQMPRIDTNNQQPPSNDLIVPALQSLSQQLSSAARQQHQQPLAPRPQNHSNSNNYSTSNLSLQHLVANRPSAHSCMYLAAALARATAGLRRSQQQLVSQPQHPPTNHQATPINQPTNPVNPVSTATTTNQVPLLNFNSYSQTPPFLDLSAPLPAPPIAAHLSSSPIANIQRLTNSISTPVAQNLAPTSNTSVTAAPSQQQAAQNFRDAQPQPAVVQQQSQQPPQQQPQQLRSSPVQQLFQDFLINDQFHAILLNQLFPNQPFSLTLGGQPNQQQQQPQQMVAQPVNPTRPQTLNQTGQAPVVMPPAQQISTQIPQHIQPSELIFEQAQQQHQQNHQPNNLAPRNEPFASAINANLHQANQPNGTAPQHRSPVEPATQNGQTQPSQPPQQHQSSQTQFGSHPPPPQQHQQPQGAISPMTLYSALPPNLSETLALLANPSVTNNLASSLFNYVFSLHLQNGGFRAEPHESYQHASHHFHHLHNSHHHHHHPNGQANGQEATMPLDSMAISESKPRGLNRAEIDSLTPYIHTNEKDSRTCVICLSKFELKSKIRPLPCNHAFHAKCVDKWLRANRSCPICRRDALKTYNAKLKRI